MTELQEARIQYSDIPKRFLDADVSDFSMDEMKIAKTFINGVGWRCLMIVGPLGSGKSHMGAAIGREFCENKNAIYTSAYSMSRRIIADKNADHFNKYPLLIIDELTRSFDSKSERDRFFDLINYRYENMLPVVMIGNAEPKEMMEIVGPAVGDRMKESITILTMTGKSRR